MVSRVAEFERVVLGPLTGRPENDWQRAPAGKWTPAQIVEHLAISLERSAQAFEAGKGGPQRRRLTPLESAARWLVFGLGWTPPGVRAARGTTPAARVDAADAERHFRDGLARWAALESHPGGASVAFVKHPRLGDLDLDEWLRFHQWHCGHHAKQIRRRLAG